MDTFVEQIIAQKRSWKAWIVMLTALIVAMLVWVAAFLALAMSTSMIMPGALIGILVSWLAYKLILMQDVEYEYSVTNGDIDIDRIVGKSKRTRVVSVSARKVEQFCEVQDGIIPAIPHDRLVMAAPSVAEATWAFAYYGKKNGRTLVVFSPDDRVLNAIKSALPRTVLDSAENG